MLFWAQVASASCFCFLECMLSSSLSCKSLREQICCEPRVPAGMPILCSSCYCLTVPLDMQSCCHADSSLHVHAGNSQGRLQRLSRWLTSLWRPAPYTYLDQSSAAVADNHPQQPVTSAFHVTQGSAVDLHHFQPDSSAVTHSHMDVDLHHGHVAASELHDRHTPDEWHSHRNQGNVVYSRVSSSEEQQQAQGQGQQDVGQSSSTQEAATDVNRRRGPNTSRWQSAKRQKGRQPKSTSGAEGSLNKERQQKRSQASQIDVLRNVKAVVPYLSDEVILAELDCTLDVNQAVENLLSRM